MACRPQFCITAGFPREMEAFQGRGFPTEPPLFSLSLVTLGDCIPGRESGCSSSSGSIGFVFSIIITSIIVVSSSSRSRSWERGGGGGGEWRGEGVSLPFPWQAGGGWWFTPPTHTYRHAGKHQQRENREPGAPRGSGSGQATKADGSGSSCRRLCTSPSTPSHHRGRGVCRWKLGRGVLGRARSMRREGWGEKWKLNCTVLEANALYLTGTAAAALPSPPFVIKASTFLLFASTLKRPGQSLQH